MRNFLLPMVIVVGQILLLTKLRFTVWPEMLAYPYLLSKGFHFYNDIIHPYLPFLPYIIYFLGKIIGLNIFTVQIITYLLIFLNGIIFWNISSKWFSEKMSVFLLCLYVILSTLFEVNGLWFDLATVPLILLSFLLFIKDEKLKKLSTVIIIGILLGIAFITKQTSLFFILSLIIYLSAIKQYRKVVFLMVGAMIPSISLVFFFKFSDLWNWGVVFPFIAIGNLPGYILIPSLRQLVILAIVFLPLIYIYKVNDKKIIKILIWLLPSILFLVPRFDYFHLHPLLPFYVLFLGIIFTKLKITQAVYLPYSIYFVSVSVLLCRYSIKNFGHPVRFFEPSVITTSKILSQTFPEDEPVLFYNTTANYFVTANLLPVKPWVDYFPWYMELPGMQEKIINVLENGNVQQVVYTEPNKNGKWELGTYVPEKLDHFVNEYYTKKLNLIDNIYVLTK